MMAASLQWLMLVSFMWSSGDSILRTCMISFAVDQRFPDSLIRNDRCQRKTGTPFCWYRLPWLQHFHHIFDVRQPKLSLWAWQRSFRKDHLDKVGTQGRRKKIFCLKNNKQQSPKRSTRVSVLRDQPEWRRSADYGLPPRLPAFPLTPFSAAYWHFFYSLALL